MNKKLFKRICCSIVRKVHPIRLRTFVILSCTLLVCVTCFAAGIGYRTIQVNYSGTQVKIHGKAVSLKDAQGAPAEVFNYNGTVYAPIRAIAEAFGNEVGWDAMNKTIIIGNEKELKQELPKLTLKHFLEVAMQPVGTTMYVWGGGWSDNDIEAGPEAVSIGVSPRWNAFYQKQTSAYDYNETRYQTHDGLDCSGYVGWAVYNLLNTKSGGSGYVVKSTEMSRSLAGKGFGTYREAPYVTDFRPGDVMSTTGHVYIVVGQCSDGSVVIAHSSPPGVQLCGTAAPDGTIYSEAVRLAEEYMGRYFSEWHSRYPKCSRGTSYLTNYNQMRWNVQNGIIKDPDGLSQMQAGQVLKVLFNE